MYSTQGSSNLNFSNKKVQSCFCSSWQGLLKFSVTISKMIYFEIFPEIVENFQELAVMMEKLSALRHWNYTKGWVSTVLPALKSVYIVWPFQNMFFFYGENLILVSLALLNVFFYLYWTANALCSDKYSIGNKFKKDS